MKTFPIIHQHDSMQCGIACLAMVCKHFGREYSLDALSHICFATNEGVSLLGISEAAKIIGLETVSGKMTVDQLSNGCLPLHSPLEPKPLRGALPHKEREEVLCG